MFPFGFLEKFLTTLRNFFGFEDFKPTTQPCTMAPPNLQVAMSQVLPSSYSQSPFYVDQDSMYRERNRLSTYTNWPVSHKSPQELAGAGLFYLNYRDLVECAFCGVQIGGWETEDVPLEEHEKWSPSCPFVQGQETANVPLVETDSVGDVCGLADLSGLAISTKRERWPSYALKADREKTFRDWPLGLRQRPKDLVDAGFFYTGKGDETVCFHCGKGLKHWEPEDDVWVEHAKQSPSCTFVRMQKDDEFIRRAQLTKTATPIVVDSTTKEEEQSCDNPEDQCKICLDQKASVVFLPCKHMVACGECSINLKKCPICRKKIENFLKVYRS